MSDGDLSGMDREVVEDRVVAIDAVVASSNDGGVHGRRSGRPGGNVEIVKRPNFKMYLLIKLVFVNFIFLSYLETSAVLLFTEDN